MIFVIDPARKISHKIRGGGIRDSMTRQMKRYNFILGDVILDDAG
jgi:hypothetical protein